MGVKLVCRDIFSVHIRRSEIVSGIRLAATDAFITDKRERGSQPDFAQQPKRNGIVVYGEEWCRRRIAGSATRVTFALARSIYSGFASFPFTGCESATIRPACA